MMKSNQDQEGQSMLTNIEQETVITFNAEEPFAEVYTCYPPQIRKLDKYCAENPDEWQVIWANEIGKTYRCPKKLITFRTKSVKPNLTDEQRKASAERIRELRNKGKL